MRGGVISENIGVKWSLVLFFCVFYFYNVNFSFLPVTSFIWAPLGVICFSVYLMVIGVGVYKHLSMIVFAWLAFAIISLLSFYHNLDEYDLGFMKLVVAFFISAILAPWVLLKLTNNNYLLLFKIIGLVGFVNAIFIIGMFFFPGFKISYHSIISPAAEVSFGVVDLDKSYMSLRMVGVDGFSAYATAVKQVIFAIIYSLYVYFCWRRPGFLSGSIIIVICISAVIAARTSFILLPIFFAYYIYLFGFISSVFLVLCLSTSVIGVLLLLPVLLSGDFADFFINWIGVLFSGNLNDIGSFKTNVEMYKYGFFDFSFFGDFKLIDGEGGYHMGVDVGWYRLLFAVGYFGFLGFIGFLFSCLCYGSVGKPARVVFHSQLFVLFILFVVMFKGAILLDAFPLITILVVLKIAAKELHGQYGVQHNA